jgi:hypothetical protein
MYGYTGAYDPAGGAVFQAWILAKKAGRSEADINELLAWGQETLKERTVGLPARPRTSTETRASLLVAR